MAIQVRRGANADFRPEKMKPGELAVTLDGARKVYATFSAGDVKELITREDVWEELESVDAVRDDAQLSAEAAKASENNAAASEEEAKGSEEAAKQSELNAKASENNAKTSKEAAKQSELNAKASENAFEQSEANVEGYAQSAKASEKAAQESEAAAEASKTAAADSEAAAEISATNSNASEEKAKASETNAKASETAAKQSETNAKASEAAAKESETAAERSAEAAKQSELNAKASEEAAKDSEDRAEASAGAAKASEDGAAASETAAKASETDAQSSAKAAKASETAAAADAADAAKSKTDAETAANTATTEAAKVKTWKPVITDGILTFYTDNDPAPPEGYNVIGPEGKTPTIEIGANENWLINGVDTGKPSRGDKGDTSILTIGENGNFFINGEDTGQKAQGARGSLWRHQWGKTPTLNMFDDEQVGDMFLDTNGYRLFYRSESRWEVLNSIQGPQGVKGNGWYAVDEMPPEGGRPTGLDGLRVGDFFLETSTGRIFQYTSSGIPFLFSIIGKDGVTPEMTISTDGFWEINDVKTDKKAVPENGKDGEAGPPGPPGANGKDGADGAPGQTGPPGANGKDGVDGKDGNDGAPGTNGKDGPAATVRIGNVTTGEPGTPAAVNNTGTETNAVLDFTIPRGNPGDTSGPGSAYDLELLGGGMAFGSPKGSHESGWNWETIPALVKRTNESNAITLNGSILSAPQGSFMVTLTACSTISNILVAFIDLKKQLIISVEQIEQLGRTVSFVFHNPSAGPAVQMMTMAADPGSDDGFMESETLMTVVRIGF